MCGDMVSVNYNKCTKSYRISVQEIPFLCFMLILMTADESVHSHPRKSVKKSLFLSFLSSTRRQLVRASWFSLSVLHNGDQDNGKSNTDGQEI